MAALSTAIIIGSSVAAVGAVTAGAIMSQGARSAAETAAEANQQAIAAQQEAQATQISAQERAAAEQRTETERIAAEQKAAAEKAAAEKAAILEKFKYPGILETPEGLELKETYRGIIGKGIETPESIKLKGTLEERMAGIGVGYTPTVVKPSLIDINKVSAPFAAQIRAGFKEQTIPAITAAASARGLGRSTIPVSQIGVASQAAERDIESRIAELTLTNAEIERQANLTNAQLEQQAKAQGSVDIQNALTQYGGLTEQKRVDIQNALTRYQEITGQQVTAKQIEEEVRLEGGFKIAETRLSGITNAADTELTSANTRFSAATVAANQRLISSATLSELISTGGATQAAYELQQAAIWGSAISQAGLSFSQAYTRSNDDIIKAIESQQQQNAARVNIAGFEEPVLTAPANYYRRLPLRGYPMR